MIIHKTFDTDAHVQKMGDPLTGSRCRRGREERLHLRPISFRSLVAGTLIALLLSDLALLFGPGSHASAMGISPWPASLPRVGQVPSA